MAAPAGPGPGFKANARWDVSHCPSCDRFRCLLVSTVVIPSGTPIKVDAALLDPVSGCPRDYGLEVTYDGATAKAEGTQVSGAAAILWGPIDNRGHRAILAKRFLALPGSPSSELAEARGAALAIHLALDHCYRSPAHHPGSPILVAGDNPVISRYCASQARRDSADVHAILDGPLSLAAASGRSFEWILFPRALSPEAHDAATSAAAHATCRVVSGIVAPAHWSE